MIRYGDLLGNDLIATSNYFYDENGRLIQLKHSDVSQVLAEYGFNYDGINRLIKLTSNEGISEYEYDAVDQIIEANYDERDDESYSYDANGNRTNNGYVTGKNNLLLSDGFYLYEYDGEGNRIKKVEITTGIVDTYSWDYENRLIAVVTRDGNGNVIESIEYVYDVFGKRIAKKIDVDGDGGVSAETETYVYDGGNLALVFDEEGEVKERFFYGVGVDEVLAQEDDEGVSWALTDSQGSVRDVVDDNGVLLNHVVYDSFGQVISESDSSVDFRFGYTGKETDEESGLRYHLGRYVDPFNGRFISEDALGFDAGDANLYRYVFNSPTNYTDPDGNIPALLIPLGIGAAEAIGIGLTGLGAAGLLWQFKPNPESEQKNQENNSGSKTTLDKRPERPLPIPPENQTQPNANDDCDKDKKTCATQYPLHVNYDLLKQNSDNIYYGYHFIENENPNSGINGAFKYIQDVRRGKLQSTNKNDPARVKEWWKADIEREKEGALPRVPIPCTHPPGFARHYNVELKNDSLRFKWGWPASSVGSIGKCQACKDDPNNGPQLITVFAVLNIKDVGGKIKLEKKR